MTKNQRKAVIELKQQHKQGTNNINNSTNVSQVTIDDMITLGDAIVAGVQKASADNANTEDTKDDATVAGNSQSGRVTATSGSVGSAFRNSMNNKRQKN